MAVRDISIQKMMAGFRNLHFREFSRTLIVAAQMIGDGVILTTLSYLSFSFLLIQMMKLSILNICPIFCRPWDNYNRDLWICAFGRIRCF